MSLNFDLNSALQHRVVLLATRETHLRIAALRQMTEAIQRDGFDVETVAGDERPPRAWCASIETAPFGSDRRAIIVRNLLRAGSPPKDFESELARLPDWAWVILVADDEATIDENRQRTLGTHRTAWVKAIKEGKGLVYDPSIESSNLAVLIAEACREFEKGISRPAAELLVHMTGGSLSRALDEIPKLAAFVGKEDRISEADVRAVVSPSYEWNLWELLDAVVSRRPNEALRHVRLLVAGTSKTEEAVYRNILPLLSRQLRLLWQARMCLDENTAPSRAPEEVRRAFPSKPDLQREKDFVVRKTMRQAERMTADQIAACFGILADTDAALKGALPSFSTVDTLEQMVLRMTAVLGRP